MLVNRLREQLVGQRRRALLAAVGCEELRVHESSRFFTTTRPFEGPGIAPLTRITCCSASTATTSRFLMVRFTAPMCPGRRLPLMTRDGYADEPIEPGCLPCVGPCEACPATNLWRFTTPAKPRPLVTPSTSTCWPASKIETVTLCPTSSPATSPKIGRAS